MKLRDQLYVFSLPHEVEKRRYQAVAEPAFHDMWTAHPELHPTENDSDEERMRKGDQRERLVLEYMVVNAIDMTNLRYKIIAEELRKIASLLESLENNEER